MADNKAVIGGAVGAGSGAVSGATAGTAIAPGIGTAIGAILGAIFGGASGGTSGASASTSAKKQANYASDIKVNTQHAINLFNEQYSLYSQWITPEEWNALANAEAQKVNGNPYYGGLNTSYTSQYTGLTTNTVPGVGIWQDLDSFITQKQASLQSTFTTDSASDVSTLAKNLDSAINAKIQAGDAQIQGALNEVKGALYGITVPDKQTPIDYSPYIIGVAVILGIYLFMKGKK